ncbi:MAG: type IV pilus assembly protein PilM [Planctomycetota bacterium]
MFEKKSLLGLDIGLYAIKAVEFTVIKGSLAVTGFGYERRKADADPSELIKEMIAKYKLKARRVITSVSGRSAIVRPIQMQRLTNEELKNSMRYEVDQYIPFEADEVIVDCQRLENPEGEDESNAKMDVMLASVKKTYLQDQLEMLKKAGIQPIIVDYDAFALVNAFEIENANVISDEFSKIRALIDIGASKTLVSIVHGNTPYFLREIYQAGNEITDAIARRFGEEEETVVNMKKTPGDGIDAIRDTIAPVIEDLGNEINMCFEYYENQRGHTVDEVYLSGGSIQFPGIPDFLGNILQKKTVVWDPTRNLEIQPENLNVMEFRERASELPIAVGLASRLRRL